MIQERAISYYENLASAQEKCARDPTRYNVTQLWECSKFVVGSLAERCAADPSRFGMKISAGCSIAQR